MKIFKFFLTFSIACLISAQQPSAYKNNIFEHELLLGAWAFESMTTIKKAKREEITILYKDNKNIETLHFKDSGAINYDVINDGIKKNGVGIWFSDENHLTIIVDSDTTYGTFTIDENKLTLVISAEETDKEYGYSTILKYIKNNDH
tara:strand:+ start:177 stop:617 length:441 start_codon:yes stop_codon:yes gene_type:complete